MPRFFSLDAFYLAAVIGCHVSFAIWSAYAADSVTDLAKEIVPFAQAALLVLWLMVGPGPKRIRWLAVPLLAAVLLGWPEIVSYWSSRQVFPLALWLTAMLGVAGVVLRTSGFRVRSWEADARNSSGPAQFSIRSLLIATAIVGLALASGRWVHSHILVSSDMAAFTGELQPHLARATMAATLAGVSLAALFCVLAARRVWLWSLLLLPAAFAFGTLASVALHEESHWDSVGLWVLLHAVVMVGTLAPLRNLEFRLVRMGRTPATSPTQVRMLTDANPLKRVTTSNVPANK